jgi:hypothetical protein
MTVTPGMPPNEVRHKPRIEQDGLRHLIAENRIIGPPAADSIGDNLQSHDKLNVNRRISRLSPSEYFHTPTLLHRHPRTGIADAEDIMFTKSNNAARPAGVTFTPEGVGFWILVALVLLAVAACAFLFADYVADGAGQASLVAP